MKKKLALLLAVCMMGTMMFTACNSGNGGSSGTAYKDDGKPVTLKWILAGTGKQPIADEVWAEFNKQLETLLPNTKVDFEVVPMTDYTQKWNLFKASSEQIDIAWAGWLTPFQDDVAAGAYIPMTDMLNNDCKDLKASLPDWVWQKASINGQIYAVPNYQVMNDVRPSLQYYKDTADLIDVNAWTDAYAKNPSVNADLWQMWDDQFAKLKDAGKLRGGFGGEGNLATKGYENIAGTAYIAKDDESLKVVDQMTLESQITYNDAVRRWYEKGYVKDGIQNMTQQERDNLGKDPNNAYSLLVGQYYQGGREASISAQLNHDIQMLPLEDSFYITSGNAPTMNAITRTSINPVRAMKLLELINTEKGKDLFNLLVYGIEGKSYTKTDDGRIAPIGYTGAGAATADSPYGLNDWTIGNVFNGYVMTPTTKDWNDYVINDVHAHAKISPANGFSFDPNPVKTEITNINAVKAEFLDIFRWGAYADYKDRWQQYNDKLETAGKQKVLDEVQKQLDAWKANKASK